MNKAHLIEADFVTLSDIISLVSHLVIVKVQSLRSYIYTVFNVVNWHYLT